MKNLDRVKRMLSLVTEAVLLADKLDEDEKELLLVYSNYDEAKRRYNKALEKFVVKEAV